MPAQPRGRCSFCGHETTKGSMKRHLAGCPQRQDKIAGAVKGRPEPLFHLRMQDGYGGPFWFDAEVTGTATLAAIDDYLRAIWLECCGHLSRFSRGGWGGQEIAQGRRVGKVFGSDHELTHIYDFGTESVTQIKVVDTREAVPLTARPIALMARNLAPDVQCIDCDQPASHLCQECQIEWESPGTLCRKHVERHPHEDYGEPIEIVNSPRLGLCGYAGPADPPY